MRLRVLLVFALACWASSAQARLFDDIFVFGDSLSDGGNAYALTGGFPPYVYPPGTDTKRATNGPTAAEVMAIRLGAPVMASQSGGTNYAVMGAATHPYVRTDLPDPPAGFPPPPLPAPVKPGSVVTSNYVPFAYWYLNDYHYGGFAGYGIDSLKPYGVDKQVEDFLAAPPAQDPNRSLFVIWTGVNDFLLGDAMDFLAAAGGIASFVAQLYDDPNVAARHFLVPNIPDLAQTPDSLQAFALLPPDEAAVQAAQLRGLTQTFNATLAGSLAAVEAPRPGMTIVEFDTFSFVDAILADGGAYGFTHTTQPCVDRNNPAIVCADPDQYAFWDGFHPSAASHALIGEAFAAAITQAIPEPSTYVLMAAGLLVLVVLRRRVRAQ